MYTLFTPSKIHTNSRKKPSLNILSCFRCTGRFTDTPRQQVNRLTSYIDGSVVYGESETRSKALREFKDGKLKLGPDALIPVG